MKLHTKESLEFGNWYWLFKGNGRPEAAYYCQDASCKSPFQYEQSFDKSCLRTMFDCDDYTVIGPIPEPAISDFI